MGSTNRYYSARRDREGIQRKLPHQTWRSLSGSPQYDGCTGSWKKVFCSATAISETRVLTSRHCFFHRSSGAERSREYRGLLRGDIAYHPNDGSSSRTVLSGTVNTLRNIPYKPADDIVELDLSGDVPSFAPIARNGLQASPSGPTSAWLVGNHPTVPKLNSSFLGRVRGSVPIACSILEISDENCLYHVCQSSKSTSGGGLLVQTANGLQIVGVHRGTMAAAAGCEADPDELRDLKQYQINIAAYLR